MSPELVSEPDERETQASLSTCVNHAYERRKKVEMCSAQGTAGGRRRQPMHDADTDELLNMYLRGCAGPTSRVATRAL